MKSLQLPLKLIMSELRNEVEAMQLLDDLKMRLDSTSSEIDELLASLCKTSSEYVDVATTNKITKLRQEVNGLIDEVSKVRIHIFS